MTSSYSLPYMEAVPITIQFIGIGLILFAASHIYSVLVSERPYTQFPVVSLSEKGLNPKQSFNKHGSETVMRGVQSYSGCFQIITGTGPKIVVPNRFADELKSHDSLSFNEAFQKEFFADYPGFEPFREGLKDGHLIPETVRVKLTQSLGLITNDLVDETTQSIHDLFGENKEWHSIAVKQDVLDLVSRLSSRVFLGKDLCRNKRWLQIAKDYTVDSFIAAYLMRALPALARPLAHWFLPHNIRIRAAYRDAGKLILPEIERRKERTRKAMEAGGKAPKTADTIGWLYEIGSKQQGREIDYVAAQLSLTLAAIHTTSESISRAMLDICEHPEIVQPLRDEIIQVIGDDGWSKVALYKLKLMDSFIKESMRTGAMTITSMNRLVKKPVQLSDGTILPKGSRIMVASQYSDPAVYPNPEQFQADRFLRLRENPDQHNSWQHVTTSSEHLGFGHGKHACPGRFFASNEMKIAIAHLLMKYDWELTPEGPPAKIEFDGTITNDPHLKIMTRRRKEEIMLDIPADV